MPKAETMQKALSAGKVLLDPMINAKKSVMEVTVIDGPARPKAVDSL